MSNMISKSGLVNLATPDINITHLKSTDPKLYNAVKNLGSANASLINQTFPPQPQNGYRGRIIIPGNPTVANDILSHRYHVVLPTDPTGYWTYTQINLTAVYVTAMTVGTTSTLSLDVKISQQKGTTSYKSLFKPGMNPMLPVGVVSTHDVQFAINTLYQDDLGRVDILATDPAVSNIEIVIVGNYSMVQNEVNTLGS
jgi:hypothetical protein